MKFSPILLLGLTMLLTSCSTVAPLFGKHKSAENAALPAKGQIKQVALLLPLKGGLAKKAETVRDGFLASYYQAPGSLTIHVLDTPNANTAAIYDEAVSKGAHFVVGPLERDQVKSLVQRGRIPVATLTLNYTEGALPAHLYQFGLSPLDEATQVAQRAWREGHRKALIVVSGDNWGRRMGATLTENWVHAGGTVVSTMTVSAKQNIVDQLHALVPSEDKSKLQSPPFDVVLLATLPGEARSVVSMFRFYGLVQTPFYATSSIYSGVPSPADKDLESVRICDIPWVVNPTPEMVHATQQLRTLHPDIDLRLYALGVDAYRLIDELPVLASSSAATYAGLTGVLSLEGQRIKRVLAWGQFVNGQIVPLS